MDTIYSIFPSEICKCIIEYCNLAHQAVLNYNFIKSETFRLKNYELLNQCIINYLSISKKNNIEEIEQDNYISELINILSTNELYLSGYELFRLIANERVIFKYLYITNDTYTNNNIKDIKSHNIKFDRMYNWFDPLKKQDIISFRHQHLDVIVLDKDVNMKQLINNYKFSIERMYISSFNNIYIEYPQDFLTKTVNYVPHQLKMELNIFRNQIVINYETNQLISKLDQTIKFLCSIIFERAKILNKNINTIKFKLTNLIDLMTTSNDVLINNDKPEISVGYVKKYYDDDDDDDNKDEKQEEYITIHNEFTCYSDLDRICDVSSVPDYVTIMEFISPQTLYDEMEKIFGSDYMILFEKKILIMLAKTNIIVLNNIKLSNGQDSDNTYSSIELLNEDKQYIVKLLCKINSNQSFERYENEKVKNIIYSCWTKILSKYLINVIFIINDDLICLDKFAKEHYNVKPFIMKAFEELNVEYEYNDEFHMKINCEVTNHDDKLVTKYVIN